MTNKYFVLIFFMLALNIQAQEIKNKKDELLLYSQFGEFCTMCEATIVCSDKPGKTGESFLDDESYALIHLETRTFWSQISTIWEFFVRNFEGYEVKGHSRPVIIYYSQDGKWSDIEVADARISVDPNLIQIKQFVIDRVSREWISQNDQSLGTCKRVPLWKTLEYVNQRISKSNNNE